MKGYEYFQKHCKKNSQTYINFSSVCLKLVAVLKPLLERDVIKETFIPNFSNVIQLFADELDRCKHLFDSHLEQVK